MSRGIRGAIVIAKRRIFETFINPGYYIAVTIGLLIGYVLITGFVNSIDSSGFDFAANPLYELLVNMFHGAFGETFLEKLFAEGPYLLAFMFSFAPILVYLLLGTITRFSFEKKVGAVLLLMYGPVTESDIMLSFFIKDFFFSILSLCLLFFFFLVSALINNLLLGPVVLYSLILGLFLSVTVSAYGILASAATRNIASAVALFTVTMLLFFSILLGSFASVGGYARNLATTMSWLFRWISPFYYLDMGMRALQAGSGLGYIVALLGFGAILVIQFFAGKAAAKTRGSGR